MLAAMYRSARLPGHFSRGCSSQISSVSEIALYDVLLCFLSIASRLGFWQFLAVVPLFLAVGCQHILVIKPSNESKER
jgi:hypothetical protein